jgi:ribonucleoside-diphosphate reductase subunit M2
MEKSTDDSGILDGDLTRYAYFPIENPELEKLFIEQRSLMWVPDDIDFSTDRASWYKLDDDTKNYIKFLLALFAQLDGIVNENLVRNFKEETRALAKECGLFYAYQEAIECTHNETYSKLIKSFVGDAVEQKKCLNSINSFPAIRKIAEWSATYMHRKFSLLERIIAFACIEGIIFSSAFAGIYWIKRRNILHGLTQANSWIARDEGLHTRFAVTLYHHIVDVWKIFPPLDAKSAHTIIRSAVDVTEEFTRTAMNVDLVGLNADDMVAYVQRTSDVLSTSLGYGNIYNVESPFDWMAIITLPNKTNFFESKVSEYAKENRQEEGFVFDLNAKF